MRRIRVLFFWVLKFGANTSIKDMLRFIFTPKCEKMALKYIAYIENENSKYLKVKCSVINCTLFYPKNIGLHQLYQVVTETFNIKDWHYYQIDETKVLQDDIVLDCGAAEGLFSLSISDTAKAIWVVEPMPLYHECLKETFKNRANVEILPVALGSKRGNAYISNEGVASSISEQGEFPVNIDTIDNLFFDKGINFTYLKADLEGYEIEMLKGGINSIRKFKPKIAITTYHVKDHADEISRFLKSLNVNYQIRVKGIEERAGSPVMLHAWVE